MPYGEPNYSDELLDLVPDRELMRRFRNSIGPQLAAIRKSIGMTQDQLAAKLQLAGLESIDRVGVVKIESQIRSVFDFEIQVIAEVLKVETSELFPDFHITKKNLPELRRGLRGKR